MAADEGFVDFGSFRTWYRRVGPKGPRAPLLVLHGGPGFPHDYLLPLEQLGSEREVVFYDQLGCGRSAGQDPPAQWTLDLFVDELANLRERLGLERVHLLGHSWGGWLAIEHVARGAAGVAALVLASAPASVPEFVEGMRSLVNGLSWRSRRALLRHRAGKAVASATFTKAYGEFLRKHWCRMQPVPEPLARSWARSAPAVYEALWGPSELVARGELASWDASTRLTALDMPVLLTRGAFDEVCAETLEAMLATLPRAALKVYRNSAHMPHLEDQELYLNDIARFLREADDLGS